MVKKIGLTNPFYNALAINAITNTANNVPTNPIIVASVPVMEAGNNCEVFEAFGCGSINVLITGIDTDATIITTTTTPITKLTVLAFLLFKVDILTPL